MTNILADRRNKAMVTLNNLLWYSMKKQLEWENQQDWTGVTKEEKQKILDQKGVEIYKELKEKYYDKN